MMTKMTRQQAIELISNVVDKYLIREKEQSDKVANLRENMSTATMILDVVKKSRLEFESILDQLLTKSSDVEFVDIAQYLKVEDNTHEDLQIKNYLLGQLKTNA